MFEEVETTEHGKLLFNGGNIFLNKETKHVFIAYINEYDYDRQEIEVIEEADENNEPLSTSVYKIIDEMDFNDFLNIAKEINFKSGGN